MKCYLLFYKVFDGHNLRINEGTKKNIKFQRHMQHWSHDIERIQTKHNPQKNTTKKTKKEKPPKPGMNQSSRFV